MHEIGSKRGQSIVLSVSPAIVQGDVPTFDESGIIQALPDHRDEGRVDGGRTGAEYANHRHRGLLRPRRERPRGRRAAECGQHFPPSDGDCHAPLPCEGA